MDKIDLVMWTKNGAGTLPLVLKRINDVIPSEFVGKRIIVDDHSTDKTREISKSFGWRVIFNEGKGISDGANTALKHVTTDFFISFEQDILLSKEWWQKIPKHLEKPRVAIASGIRLCKGLETLAKIEDFAYERYKKKYKIGKFEQDVQMRSRRLMEEEKFLYKFIYGKTIDNTIYQTKIIRQLGGFPKLSITAGVDSVLAYRTHLAGYEWFVDHSVKSEHLRKGFRDELAHRYWYGTCYDELSRMFGTSTPSLRRQILRLLFSPIRGLEVGIKKNDLKAIYVYPLIRLNVLRGIVHSRKHGTF